MEVSEAHIQEVESMAGLFLEVEKIAIAMQWSETEMEDFKLALETGDRSHPFHDAYWRGRITTEIELRQSIRMAAKNGSNPAQNTMIEFFNRSKL